MSEIDDALRAAFWAPCETKEDLRRWVKIYLDVDLPDSMVCDDEVTEFPTNSSPMDLLFEIYSNARIGNPEFQNVLGIAARDAGKCVERGTKIKTSSGLKNIEDVKVGDTVWTGFSFRKVTNTFDEGIKSGVRLEIADGRRLTTSNIHCVWTWSPGMMPTWKRVADLTPSDLVAVDNVDKNFKFNQDDYDVAYILGVIQGDGCTRLMPSSVTVSSIDPCVIEKWNEFCVKNVGKLPRRSTSRPCDYILSSVELCDKLNSLGIKKCYSFEKEVPYLVYKNKSTMTGFIAGLIDTDGSWPKVGGLSIALTSEKMLRQCQIILSTLGCDSYLRKRKKRPVGGNHDVWILTVRGVDLDSLFASGVKCIATKANKPRANILRCASTRDSVPKSFLKSLFDSAPGASHSRAATFGLKPKARSYKTVTRNIASEFLDFAEISHSLDASQVAQWRQALGFRWKSVVLVEPTESHFYDLTVEEEHSYWSNGIVSHNTLLSSIAEILCLFHLHRDVAHLAANLQQSKVCTKYLASFFKRQVLRDYLSTTNERTVGVEWYQDRQGNRLDRKSFEKLKKSDPKESDGWKQYEYSVVVMVATPGGVNGVHRPFVVCDETELVPDEIYQEMLVGVPAPTRDGKPPIVLAISTRKTGIGQVQKLLDNAHQNGVKVRLWNLLDVTQACPPERHLPHEPKIPIYIDRERLIAIGKTDYEALGDEERNEFEQKEGYAGCLSNCRLYSSCQGRLSFKQKNNVRFLKSLDVVTEKFRAVSAEKARAQILCWRPGTHGLIYPYLRRQLHVKTAAEIYEMMTGESMQDRNFGKQQLVNMMKTLGCKFYAGYDWGFTHNFAVVVGALWGNVLYVFHVIAMPELETTHKISVCDQQIRHLGAVGYPDPEDPASIAAFRRAGYDMRSFKKDVLAGIEAVRAKIMPSLGGRPEIYFLADDPGVELLFKRMTQHHWKIDAAGEPTSEPHDKDTDECDSMRYLCQNLFARHIGRRPSEVPTTQPSNIPQVGALRWDLRDEIGQRIGAQGNPHDASVQLKRGRLFFSV